MCCHSPYKLNPRTISGIVHTGRALISESAGGKASFLPGTYRSTLLPTIVLYRVQSTDTVNPQSLVDHMQICNDTWVLKITLTGAIFGGLISCSGLAELTPCATIEVTHLGYEDHGGYQTMCGPWFLP